VKKRDGFTLVELLVVLAIIAVLCMIAIPSLSILPHAQLKSTTRELAAALSEARSRAIYSNSEVAFSLDTDRHYFKLSGDKRARTLPSDVHLSLFIIQQERFAPTVGRIRFFPDGSSTGGRIGLSTSNDSYSITVHWLTGSVAVTDNLAK